MKQDNYSEQLKDPRWQKKRLEILQRDDFTCQICGHKDKTLHVHHVYYKKGLKPWEYKDSSLITLCEDCHHEEHQSRRNILDWINYLQEQGILMIEIEALFNDMSILVSGWKNPDGIVQMLGGPILEHDGEKQDWWGLDCPSDLCERIAEWRRKVL